MSAPVPFGFRSYWDLVGLGLGGFGTKGLGTGLDNIRINLKNIPRVQAEYVESNIVVIITNNFPIISFEKYTIFGFQKLIHFEKNRFLTIELVSCSWHSKV